MAVRSTDWPAGSGEMADSIRAFDWASTPLGPIDGWPQSRKSIVDLMLGSEVIMAAPWGPQGILLYNDAYARLIGPRGATALGRPVFEALPELRETLEPQFAEVRSGRTLRVTDVLYPFVRGTTLEDAWFDISCTPVRDEQGGVVAVLGFLVETTERVLSDRRREEAEATMLASEERLTLAAEIGGIGHWELDLATNELTTSALCRRNFGRPEDAPFGYADLVASIHPDDRERQQQTVAAAIEAKSGFEIDYRLKTPEGETRWAQVRGRYQEGRRPRLAGVSLDITARKRAELAQREGEEQRSFLLKLSDAVRPLAGPADIQGETTRLLREQLNAAWCYYVDWDLDRKAGLVLRDSAREGLPSLAGAHDVSDAPELLQLLADGAVRTVRDYAGYEQLSARIRQNFVGLGFRSMMMAPLVKEGRLIATLIVGDTEVRDWSASEASLLVEAAERTWAAVERARAEAELAASEEKYRTLFDSIDEGLAIVEMVSGDDGEIVDMVFRQVNAAYERQGGITNVVGRTVREMLPGVEDVWLDRYKTVARTGEPLRVEDYQQDVDRWFDVSFTRIDEQGRFVAIVFNDISERKRAEAVLRRSEERQSSLLKLSDAIRPNMKADAVGALATRMVAEHLGVDRCYIARFAREEEKGWVGPEFRSSGLPALTGEYRFADFPEIIKRMETGPLVIRDGVADRSLAETDRQSYQALGLRAVLTAPLRRGEGNAVWSLTAAATQPRDWTDGELKLLEDVAERTWAAVERARAEEALRESEARFQQFAHASAAGLWIRDAKSCAMEYVSPAIGRIYGVAPGAILGDAERWAALIVPEDRDVALAHLKRAGAGDATVHEFRIQRPSDGAFRWIRDTVFPLEVNGHVQRIGGIGEDVTEARLAVEHQSVLLAELQHRVRNIMAIIRSIVSRTAAGAASVAEYRELLTGRLLTLARVQTLLTRAANAGVGMATIVHNELGALAANAGQFDASGPDIELSPKAAETITLAIHELTTNALKYGALSVPDGRVHVRWELVDRQDAQWLRFDWRETGAPPRPTTPETRRRGFGRELIEGRIPYELGGRGEVAITAEGAYCHLEFPLAEGASMLETDAPEQALVFGGAIDMMGEADLGGQRILVLEDDYYLATDTVRALKGAGATVLGPSPTEAAARAAIADAPPTAAVLDINLGGEQAFGLARELRMRGTPFVFITGYDREVIPEEFTGIARLQKPVEFRKVIAALAEALGVQA